MKYIPEEDFIKLLVDLHITDAIAMNHDINNSFGRLDSTLLYGTVLKKHGYSYQQMKNTMDYYSDKPDKFIEIYNEVFAILSKRSVAATEQYNALQIPRTLTIWDAGRARYDIKNDSAHYPPPFDFQLDTTGTFVLSVEVKMAAIDQSVNPEIEAYFYNPEDLDTNSRIYIAQQPIMKSDGPSRPREYTFFKEMNDPQYSRMRITIPTQENTDSVFTKDLEIRNLRVAIKTSQRTK